MKIEVTLFRVIKGTNGRERGKKREGREEGDFNMYNLFKN